MRSTLAAGLASLTAAWGLATSPGVRAELASGHSINSGAACQLSIPTTDTGARPRATGFRNESTTVSNFVICPISASVAQSESTFTALSAVVQSLDGTPRNITCTGVVGSTDIYSMPYTYSSKTLRIGSTAEAFIWDAGDFGGNPGYIPGSSIASITCLLPSQTSIRHIEGVFDYDVGT